MGFILTCPPVSLTSAAAVEDIQDAIGSAALIDSATIDATYNDGANTFSFDVKFPLLASSPGSDTAPTYTLTGSLGSGLYFPGPNSVGLSGNANRMLELDAASGSARNAFWYLDSMSLVGNPTVAWALATSTGTLQIPRGTAALPSLFFVGEPTTGITRPAANTLAITCSANRMVDFSSAGSMFYAAGDLTYGLNIIPNASSFIRMQMVGGANNFWIQSLSQTSAVLSLATSGTANLFTITQNASGSVTLATQGTTNPILPGSNNGQEFGASVMAWKRLYVGSGSAASPSMTFGQAAGDEDNGWYLSGTDEVAGATAGVQRFKFSSAGLTVTSGQLLAQDGTEGAPGVSIASTPTMGLFKQAAGIMGLSANALEQIRLDGVNTRITFPNWNNAGTGRLYLGSTTAAPYFTQNASSFARTGLIIDDSTGTFYSNTTTGDAILGWSKSAVAFYKQTLVYSDLGVLNRGHAVGGVTMTVTDSVGNAAAAGDQELQRINVGAGNLFQLRDFIHFDFAGTFAANANTKQVKVKFDGQTIIDSTALIFNSGSWRVHGRIYRITATTVKVIATISTSDPLLTSLTTYSALTVTNLTNNLVTLSSFGASGASAANDIVSEVCASNFNPAYNNGN